MSDWNQRQNDEYEILIRRAKAGDTSAFDKIIVKMRNRIDYLSNKYFFAGLDRNDIESYALLGVWSGIDNYDFGGFAEAFLFMCATRKIITILKSLGHSPKPLNLALSEAPRIDQEEHEYCDLLEQIADDRPNPFEILSTEASEIEYQNEIRNFSKQLSKTQAKVLPFYLQDKTYAEISDHLGFDRKKVDNALAGIRRKLDDWMIRNHLEKGTRINRKVF